MLAALALLLALDVKPAVAVAAGRSFDTVTTIRHGMRCPESNPVYLRPDGTFNAPKAIAHDAAFTAGALALDWVARRTGRRWFIRATQVAGYGVGAWGARQGVLNVRGCGW